MKLGVLLILPVLLAVAGCGAAARTAPTPLPTVVLGGNITATPQVPSRASGGGATASGIVVPAQEAQLAFLIGGRVAALAVAAGDQVAQGQVLAALDDAALQAQVAQVQAALATAQANYDLLAAGPTAEQRRQAQAALDGSQAELAGMVAGARPEQVAGAEANLSIAQAKLAAAEGGGRPEQIAQAEANLASVQAALDLLKKGPSDQDLALARLAVDQAKDALWSAQANRDGICGGKGVPGSTCGGANAQVAVAETGVQQAETRLAQLQAGAAPETIAEAAAAVQAAAEQVRLARQPATEQDIAQARDAVRLAEAQLALAKQPFTTYAVAAAKAQVDQAQAQLDALTAGARTQQLDAARSQVASAQAGVRAAEAQLRQASLTAPFAGTVARVDIHNGESVAPDQPVLVLADLDHLRVETTDLSERDVPGIQVGQPAVVTVKALGGDVAGRVRDIAPLSDTIGGDVIYKVTIDLDARPAGLRAGMSVDVRFGAGS